MREFAEVRFPTGFEVFGGKSKRSVRHNMQEAKVSLIKSGFLSFNVTATDLMLGKDRRNCAAFVAYNPRTKVLALRPVPFHVKPDTYAMTKTGRNSANVIISFQAQSKAWGLPLDGTTFLGRWSESEKMLLVDLSRPVAHG